MKYLVMMIACLLTCSVSESIASDVSEAILGRKKQMDSRPGLLNKAAGINADGSQTGEDSEDVPGQGPVALSISVMVLSGIMLITLAYMRVRSSIDESNFFRMGGLVLVINSGLFLIVAGYTQQQIAPMMGLLGTIAGYILGKSDDRKAK